MTILISLAAIVPTLFYVAIIYWADRYEKEPITLLSMTFLWGALPSIILAILLNTVFEIPFRLVLTPEGLQFAGNVILAPAIEETVKGIALIAIILLYRHEIDSPLDGIIYGATVGMGFAMVENFIFFSNVYGESGLGAWTVNVFFRAGVFGLNHALFSSIFGLGLAVAALTRRASLRLGAPIVGWSTAVFFHAVHNAAVGFDNALFLIAPLADWGGILLIILIIIWALRQERRWLRQYMADELVFGTLTTRQYELLSSPSFDLHLWQALLSGGFGRYLQLRRFFDLCGKLAARKHHTDVHRHDYNEDHQIHRLRAEIRELSAEI